MSLRLRALALTMLIAVAATAATAWLTLRQATDQVRSSRVADQRETVEITDQLGEYGRSHGTWDGVDNMVGELAERTGQRIHAETGNGTVVADSDLLSGKGPRAVVGAAVLVDARPALKLPASGAPNLLVRLTVTAINRYRTGTRYAACLTGAGVTLTARPDNLGVPQIVPAPAAARAAPGCDRRRPPGDAVRVDNDAARACTRKPAGEIRSCLAQTFTDRVADIAPPPLRVYLGAMGEPAPPLPAGPTVVVASGVAALAVLSALLLSRGVLRPVRALIGAAHRLGAGDLRQRVPVSGRDEIAQLGGSFNTMAESLAASEERQRQMTGDIAHELRTPLATLRGLVETLQDGYLQPTPAVLASLHEEIVLQQRIVEDLQDLASAEAGTLTYHRSDVDVMVLLNACLAAHRRLAESAGVDLAVEVDKTAWVHADPDRLRQVIGNLVTNAVRATAPGGQVRMCLSHDGVSALIQVCDTGTGVPAADLPHVFDRFWRADAARGRATGGSGLGLAIARQIVVDHGGSIDVASTVGVGTTFTVTLPSVSAPERTVAG